MSKLLEQSAKMLWAKLKSKRLDQYLDEIKDGSICAEEFLEVETKYFKKIDQVKFYPAIKVDS